MDASPPSLNIETLTVAELKSLPSDTVQPFTGVYLLRKIDIKTARNGAEFLSVEFSDASGAFHSTCFEDQPPYTILRETSEGAVIRLTGQTAYYQGRFSPRLAGLAVLDENEAEPYLTNLIETSPEDPKELRKELQTLIDRITHPTLRATVEHVFQDLGSDFHTATAALNMHHAYRHGLLEHTVHVARAAAALLPLYQEVDSNLALAGTLLHDVGKAIEYSQNLTPQRTRQGVLQGHVILGYRLIRKAALQNKLEADLAERLEHIILSHQGELEWGAATMAATPEAVFVSLVDNLDAKMGMVQHALRTTPTHHEFSAYLPGLKTTLLTTPSRLPPSPTDNHSSHVENPQSFTTRL